LNQVSFLFHVKTFDSFSDWIDGYYEMLDHMYRSYTADGYCPGNDDGVVDLFEFFDFVKENHQAYQIDGKYGLDFHNRIR
jgi:hypothetical protein